ncbi:MAG: GIN domain-containing protein [Bacteroidales bacterium]
MKIIFTFLTLALLTQPAFINAQNRITKDPGEFNALSVRGKIRTEIIPSDQNLVEIETTGTSTENVIFEMEEGEMAIRLNTDTPKEAKIVVKIYFTDLKKLSVASNALVLSPDTLKAGSLDFEAKTGGKIELKLKLKSLKADVTQGGLLVFYGEVDKQEVEVTSGGTYSAYDLIAEESYVKTTTGGITKITSTGILDAAAKLKGFIGYKGNPQKISLNTGIGGDIIDYSEE